MTKIVYKFTIIDLVKIYGNKPFYVGQRSKSKSEEHFLKESNYYGSGSIWIDCLTSLKRKTGNDWKKFVKREILFSTKNPSQKLLDKMEEIHIRKQNSLYDNKKGGTNILPGTSNNFGSGSPMKNPIVSEKVSKSMKLWWIENPEKGAEMHRKRRITLDTTDYKQRISNTLKGKYVGNENPNYGNKWTDVQKEDMRKKMTGRYIGKNNPNYGEKWSQEKRKNFSEEIKNKYKKGEIVNSMSGMKRITDENINTVIKAGEPLPKGFRFGMKQRES